MTTLHICYHSCCRSHFNLLSLQTRFIEARRTNAGIYQSVWRWTAITEVLFISYEGSLDNVLLYFLDDDKSGRTVTELC